MRIKRLELLGFKSFKDRTVISFDEGITGIVGPNGCGKSNIVDALVWVMGEMSAKHLRGSTMEDVIFAGSQDYAPMGMAEVSLTLENDGGAFPVKYLNHTEVMITRRLHRGGDSEYFINKEPCRLKDIHEIFMDTGAGSKGFSIIEQGQIGKIITSKPSERRSLIEEAAGITKFKARKKESERKLKSTDQNLLRLSDIIRELKRQLDSLERQAQKAERYKKLKTQLKDVDLWQSSCEISEGQEKHLGLQESLTEGEDKRQTLSSEISELESNIEVERSKTLEQEKDLETKQVDFKVFSDKILNEENELRELTFEIEQSKRSSEIKGGVFEQNLSRLNIIQEEKAEASEKHEHLSLEFETLDESFRAIEESYLERKSSIEERESSLFAARKSQLEVEQGLIHIEAGVEGLQDKIKDAKALKTTHFEQKEEIQNSFNEIDKRYKELSKAYEDEKQIKLEFLKDSDSLEENLKTFKESKEQTALKIDEEKQFYNKSLSKLESLKELQDQFEGYQDGIKKLLLSKKEKGIKESGLPLSDFIKTPEGYEESLESCLSDGLQGLFGVSSLSDISESLKILTTGEKRSRAQFFVSEFINRSAKANAASGSVAGTKNLGQFLNRQDDALKETLSMFYLVEDLNEAKTIFNDHHGFCITKNGEFVSSLGQVFVGAQSSGAGLFSRKQLIETLTQDVAVKLTSLETLEKQFKSVKQQIDQAETDFSSAKTKDNEQEFKVFELKKDLERSEFEKSKAENELSKINTLVTEVDQKLEELGSKSEEMTSKSIELSSKKRDLEDEVFKWDEELLNFKGQYQGLQDEVTEKKIQHASLKSELSAVTEKLTTLTERESELSSEIESLKEETQNSESFITSNSSELGKRKAQLERDLELRHEMETSLSSMRDDFEKLTQSEREMSDRLSEVKIQFSKVESSVNESKIKLEQVQENLQTVVNSIFEKYSEDLTENYKNYLDLFKADEKEDLKFKAKDLKDKISRMGEVNVSALTEFDDVKTRYEFLSEQEKDLIKAKNQLERVIIRIDKICSTRFRETFEAVNDRFKRVFPVLFGGGEARLILIEHEDETKEPGIDIEAKPPGKKAQNVSLLSGGEKALTAVSLIFSIFLVKPSPYCLLDEVDAPLDDANVFRFNDLVKEMAKRSQIIIVTHNKNTMAVNNKLYGVTQEERGVSKMVSVDLNQQPTEATA